jgi:hypothetical protein
MTEGAKRPSHPTVLLINSSGVDKQSFLQLVQLYSDPPVLCILNLFCLFLSSTRLDLSSLGRPMFFRARIFKLLMKPRIDSKKSIPQAYVAWRAGMITLCLPGSSVPSSHRLFKNSSTGLFLRLHSLGGTSTPSVLKLQVLVPFIEAITN